MANIGEINVAIGLVIDQFLDNIQTVKTSMLQLGTSLTAIGSTLTVGVTAPIVAVGEAALEAAGKFEQWETAFGVLLHSETAAKAELQSLVDFAIHTPFDIPQVVENAQKLMAFGFSANQVIPIMKNLGDAVASTGKGAAALNSLTLAFGEMESKGVLQLRQLNMVTMQGVPAIEMLAKAYGISTQEMYDSISKKLITAAEGIPILLQGISEKFGGAMDKQSQTFLGMLSNLRDAWMKTAAAIGDTLLPVAKQIEQGLFVLMSDLQSLAESFGRLPTFIQGGIIAMAAFAAAIGPVVLFLGSSIWAGAQIVGAVQAVIRLTTAFTETSVAAGAATVSTGALSVAQTETALATEAATTAITQETFQLNLFQEEMNVAAAQAAASGTQLSLLGEEIGAIGVESETAGAAMATASTGARLFAAGLAVIGGIALVGELEGIWTAIEHVGQSAAASVDGLHLSKSAMDELKSVLGNFAPATDKLNTAWEGIKTGFASTTWKDILMPQLATAKKGFEDLATSINEVSGKFPDMATAAAAALAKVNAANTKQIQDQLALAGGYRQTGASITDVNNATIELIGSQLKAEEALKVAQATLEKVKKLHTEGAASIQDVARAEEAVRVASAAANPGLTQIGDTMNKTGLSVSQLAIKSQELIDAFNRAQKAYDTLSASSDTSEAHMVALRLAGEQLKTTSDALTGSTGKLNDGFKNMGPALTGISELLVNLDKGFSTTKVNGVDMLTSMTAAQQKAKETLDLYYAAYLKGEATLEEVHQKEKALIDATRQADQNLQAFTTTVKSVPVELEGFQTGLDSVGTSFHNLEDSATDTVTVIKGRAEPAITSFADIAAKAGGGVRGFMDALADTHSIMAFSDAVTYAGQKMFDATSAAQGLVAQQKGNAIEFEHARQIFDNLSQSQDGTLVSAKALQVAFENLQRAAKAAGVDLTNLGQDADTVANSLKSASTSMDGVTNAVSSVGSSFSSSSHQISAWADGVSRSSAQAVNAMQVWGAAVAASMSPMLGGMVNEQTTASSQGTLAQQAARYNTINNPDWQAQQKQIDDWNAALADGISKLESSGMSWKSAQTQLDRLTGAAHGSASALGNLVDNYLSKLTSAANTVSSSSSGTIKTSGLTAVQQTLIDAQNAYDNALASVKYSLYSSTGGGVDQATLDKLKDLSDAVQAATAAYLKTGGTLSDLNTVTQSTSDAISGVGSTIVDAASTLSNTTQAVASGLSTVVAEAASGVSIAVDSLATTVSATATIAAGAMAMTSKTYQTMDDVNAQIAMLQAALAHSSDPMAVQRQIWDLQRQLNPSTVPTSGNPASAVSNNYGASMSLTVNVNNADAKKTADTMVQAWRSAGVPI